MKNILSIITLLTAFIINAQVEFGIGVNQNFGAIAAKNESFTKPEKNFYISNTRLGAFLSIPVDTDWHFDLQIGSSFLKDKSYWQSNYKNDVIQETVFSNNTESFDMIYRNDIAEAQSHLHTIAVSMMYSPSKYFSIGSGIGLDLHFSTFFYYDINVNYVYNSTSNSHIISSMDDVISSEEKVFSPNFIVPIKTRVHLPINRFRISLENTLVISIRNIYVQTGLFIGLF